MTPTASSPTGPPDVLVRIVEQRRERLGSSSPLPAPPEGSERFESQPFLDALRRSPGRAIIAEVKMGSPKLGDLRGRFDPEERARAYARAGAAALSVVVEPDFFHGSYELLERCQRASGLPAIAKDFLVHESQLDAARDARASAVLLIAAILGRDELHAWARLARQRGLVPLVETHDRADLAKLEGASWELVGVNNRDLRTFEVDLDHSIALVDELPEGALLVGESGIASNADVVRLREAGFTAFLVGESLVLADDPEQRLQELVA